MTSAASPRQVFQVVRLAVGGTRLRQLGNGLLIAVLGVPLALSCPFAFAGFVYVLLRADHDARRTFRELADASPGFVEVEGERIAIVGGGGCSLTRSDVVDGWIEPAGAEAHVVVRLSGARRLVMATRSHHEAEQLLTALGVSLNRQVARFAITSKAVDQGQGAVLHLLGPWLGSLWALGMTAALMAMSSTSLGVVLGIIFMVTLLPLAAHRFWRYIRRGSVTVGNDGFTVERSGTQRFYGYGEVSAVHRHGDVIVKTASGEVKLRCGTFVADDLELTEALAVRLDAALSGFRARVAEDPGGLGVLDRRGRDVATWRREILELADDRAGYRRARIDPGQLVGVVEDAAAPAERRLAAAMALAPRALDELARKRMRFAAQSCAHPGLRVALERSLEGDVELADLEAALAEEEEVKSQRSG